MRQKRWALALVCVALCMLYGCAGGRTKQYDVTYTIAVGTSGAWNPFPGARGVVYTDSTGQTTVPVTPHRVKLGAVEALIEGTAVRFVGKADGTVEIVATLDGQCKKAFVTVGAGSTDGGEKTP